MNREKVEHLLFVERHSVAETAHKMGISTKTLRKQLQEWGLEKELRLAGKRSQAQEELRRVLEELYPNTQIISEHSIGERLFLDFYLPKYRVAYEYDGPQHHRYVDFFHKDQEGFERAQQRDRRKEELCYGMGILLVRVDSHDQINADGVMLLTKSAIVHNGDDIEPDLTYKERLRRLSNERKRARMKLVYDMRKRWRDGKR